MAQFLNFKGDYKGLSFEKAEENLLLYGENIFHETEDKSLKTYQSAFNPWSIILLAAGGMYFNQGKIIAGLCACAFAVAIMVVLAGFCRSCNKKTAECTAASRMKYRVIRNGEMQLIPAGYIVPDDIIILQSGETVPADAHILELYDLKADESRFMGKKAVSEKHCGSDKTGGKLKSTCIYAGSRIIKGGCVARVVATGEDAYIIAGMDKRRKKLADPDYSEYEKAFAKIKPLLVIAAAVITAAGVLYGCFVSGNDPFNQLITAAGWLLCLIPPFTELFIKYYGIKSAARISQKGAAIKNLGSLYRLNGLDTIVLDKSAVASEGLETAGVYTKNHKLMTEVTILAGNQEAPTPTEQAFLLSAALGGADISEIKRTPPVKIFPYDSEHRLSGNLYDMGEKYLLCIKGDADTISGLCDISPEAAFDLQQRSASMSLKGMEVWATAYAILPKAKAAETAQDEIITENDADNLQQAENSYEEIATDEHSDTYDNTESSGTVAELKNKSTAAVSDNIEDDIPRSLYSIRYNYMGMVSYISSTKDTVPLAVQACRRAGLRPVLITEDSSDIAAAIGGKLGLDKTRLINAHLLREGMAEGYLQELADAQIISGVTKEQKPYILRLLHRCGRTTAAYGRNDDDYDMITAADVGITSLEHTTGSIYEASSLIIAQDSFAGIVEIIGEARRLHSNIKKCLSLFITSLVTAAILVIVSILFNISAFNPFTAVLYAGVVLPLCAVSFIKCGNNAEGGSSGFIAKGVINRKFLYSGLICGAVEGLFAAAAAMILNTLIPPAQIPLITLILLTAITCTNSFLTSGVKRSNRAIAIPALVLISTIILSYLPVGILFDGIAAPHPASFIAVVICILAAFGSQIITVMLKHHS